MKRFAAALNFILGVLFSVFILSQFAFKDRQRTMNENLRWQAPFLPDQLSFGGEKVPLERWDVKEKLEREVLLNYYNQGSIIYLLKLANRNFPIISERLKANGVPDDFKYLCIAESNMQSWAVSRSGAVGYWQFLDGTAPGYGLEVNSEVDERLHLAKATDAACRYFKQAYARFGSWTAAAAAYNCGMGGYNRQVTFQGTTNYYDLNLPEETNKYLFRILTFKHLLEQADALGFDVPKSARYEAIPSRQVTISSSIPDLAQYARSQGTTYKMLRNMNPWLKGRSLTIRGGKTYTIELPAR